MNSPLLRFYYDILSEFARGMWIFLQEDLIRLGAQPASHEWAGLYINDDDDDLLERVASADYLKDFLLVFVQFSEKFMGTFRKYSVGS